MSLSRPILQASLRAVFGILAVTLGASQAGPALAGDATSRCDVVPRTSISPPMLPLGEMLTVRYSLNFTCPKVVRPYDLAVVADADSVSTGRPGAWAAEALTGSELGLVARLAVPDNAHVRAMGVAYGPGGQRLCDLTQDPTALRLCLGQLATRLPADGATAGGEFSTELGGLTHARDRLIRARQEAPHLPTRQGILWLTAAPESGDSCPGTAGCPACGLAAQAADAVRSAGMELSIVCTAGDCQASCLSDLATPGSYYAAATWDDAAERQAALAWSSELRVRRASVRDILGSHMQVDLPSVDPEGEYEESDKSIRWRLYDVRGRSSVTFAYATRPIRAGRGAVSAYVDGAILDTAGGSTTFRIPVGYVTVAERLHRAFTPLLSNPGTDYIPLRPDR